MLRILREGINDETNRKSSAQRFVITSPSVRQIFSNVLIGHGAGNFRRSRNFPSFRLAGSQSRARETLSDEWDVGPGHVAPVSGRRVRTSLRPRRACAEETGRSSQYCARFTASPTGVRGRSELGRPARLRIVFADRTRGSREIYSPPLSAPRPAARCTGAVSEAARATPRGSSVFRFPSRSGERVHADRACRATMALSQTSVVSRERGGREGTSATVPDGFPVRANRQRGSSPPGPPTSAGEYPRGV